ncbi:MAG: PAS domain S-box protein [Candidatus Lokiarchaeota archaeon]|nr:PAS domain S-box protein [Candidatus Lokiarchaeota archaeon]
MKESESTIRILVIDDDEDLLNIAEVYLRRLDSQFEITTVNNPKKGLRMIRSGRFDLVVCDYQMPVLSGLEILRTIREEDNQIPFIIFTGRSREEVAIQALNLGATNFIKKGSDPKSQYTELAHLIKNAVRHRRDSLALVEYQKELELRNRISSVFLTKTDEDMFYEVLNIFIEALSSNFGIFGYVDEEGNYICPTLTREIWDACQVSDKTLIYPPDEWGGLWAKSMKEKKIQHSNGPFNLPEGHVQIKRVISCPIIYQGESIGNILVADKETEYDENDIRILETLTSALAPILYAYLQRDRKERQRLLAESALREERKKYRELYNNALVGLIRAKLSDGIILECNDTFASMIGFDNSEAVQGKRIVKAMHVDKEDVIRVEREIRTGSCITELSLKLLNGNNIRIRLQAKAYFEQDFFEATVIDMTEEQRARELLKYSEDKFRNIFELSPIGLAILDSDGCILEANSSILNTFGVKNLHDVLGYNIFQDPNLSLEGRKKVVSNGAYGAIAPYDFSLVQNRSLYHTSRNDVAFFDATFISFESMLNTQFYLFTVNEVTVLKKIEMKLRESEENWKRLIQHSRDVFVQTDKYGEIIFVNRSLSGIPAEKLIGQNVFDYIKTSLYDDKELLETVTKNGEIVEYQSRYFDEEEYILEITASPTFENGRISGMILKVSNVTERENLLEKLKASELKYRTLAEKSVQGVTLFQDSKCVYVNSALCKLVGYSADEILGEKVESIVEILHEDDREKALRRFYEKYSGKSNRQSMEYRFVHKDGTIKWVELFSSLIHIEKKQMLQILVIDISERKQYQQRLEKERQKLFDVLENIPAFVFISKPGGIIEWMNPIAKSLFEKEFILSEDDDAIMPMPDGIDTKRGSLRDIEWTTGDGKTFTIRSSPFIDITGERMILHVGIDISERVEFEKQLRSKKAELSEFVERIAHDLRGMLQVISGRVSLIEGKQNQENVTEIQDTIHMIQTLLSKSVALADAGLIIGDLTDVDLNELVNKIARTVIPETIKFESDHLPKVYADREKLSQVVLNLLRNAIEHGKPTKISILSEETESHSDIIFVNNGIPIDSSIRDSVLSPSFTRKSKRGIGLKIVSRIVYAHGWEISLDDKEDTSFRIRIPIQHIIK